MSYAANIGNRRFRHNSAHESNDPEAASYAANTGNRRFRHNSAHESYDPEAASYAANTGNREFDLYSTTDGRRDPAPLYEGLVSGKDGMLGYNDSDTGDPQTEFELPVGIYHLIETKAPSGYELKTEPVIVTVTSTNVTYDENTVLSDSGSGCQKDPTTGTYTLYISNTAGVELPASGGCGTTIIYIFGTLLVLVSGIALIARRRAESES